MIRHNASQKLGRTVGRLLAGTILTGCVVVPGSPRAIAAQTPTLRDSAKVAHVWLRDLATQIAIERLQRGDTGKTAIEPVRPIRVPLPPDIRLSAVQKHVFGLLAPSGDPPRFFLNQGVVDSALAHVFAKSDSSWTFLDHSTFVRLMSSLRSMETGTTHRIPDPRGLIRLARQLYKIRGEVPIAIVDVEIVTLDSLRGSSLGITSAGRLFSSSQPSFRRHRLFAAAPLFPGVAANRAKFVIDSRFVFRSRNGSPRYSIYANGDRPRAVRLGAPFELQLRGERLAFAIRDEDTRRIAVSAVKRVAYPTPLPNARLAVLRPNAQPSKRFLNIRVEQLPNLSDAKAESWTPECSSNCEFPYHKYANDDWGGTEIGVWWSAGNTGKAASARDVEPLIVIGGQDASTAEPMAFYHALEEALGYAGLQTLRSRFDLFIVGYWAGGSNSDCGDPEGDTDPCRQRGVGRSVLDNSAFFADAIRFIYEHYGVTKKASVLGISMGGIVSRLAFLGIENGPSAIPWDGAFGPIPNFAARTNPVRVWVTLDSPHQGAHIPLGLQDWIAQVGWLPGMEGQLAMLNSSSSKQLLAEHHTASNTCASACSGSSPNRRTNRAAGEERAALQSQIQAWGSFPKTVDTSVAVASGAFDLPSRTQLWKVTGAGKVPFTTHYSNYYACASYFGWEPRDCKPPDGKYYINHFDFDWPNLAPVSAPGGKAFTAYTALGPNAIPLHGFNSRIAAWKTPDQTTSIEVRLKSLVAEATYGLTSFPEVQKPSSLVDVDDGKGDELKSLRSWLEASVSGSVFVDVDMYLDQTVELDFSASVSTPLPVAGAPTAFEVGGYRSTLQSFDEGFVQLFGEGSTASFAKRHSFIPTVSALDISDAFLDAAYRARVLSPDWQPNAQEIRTRYARGLARGSFERADYLDWMPFQRALSSKAVESCAYETSEKLKIYPQSGGVYNVQISPFTFIVCQNESLEHTRMEDRAARFVLDRFFGNPIVRGTSARPPGSERPNIPDYGFERLPDVLPPLPPWPPLGPRILPEEVFRQAFGKQRPPK